MISRWLFLFVLIALPLTVTSQQKPQTASASGGDFSLTDQHGKRFRLSDHRGKVVLLFFGYTSCTEACPIILSRVNSVFKQIGADRDKVLAVFISVDPQRDTVMVLREYVKYFSANTLGLTGKKEEVELARSAPDALQTHG
jgi:cytochrome oxidase Cu insertion factor (SCO1/SenC/PrrC family)